MDVRHEVRTLLIKSLLQPVGAEKPPREGSIPSSNNQGLPADQDMHKNHLLEVFLAKLLDLASSDSLDPFQVGGLVYQAIQVKIGRYWVEFSLRME